MKARSRSRVRNELGLNFDLDGPATGAGLAIPGMLDTRFLKVEEEESFWLLLSEAVEVV